MTLLTTDYLEYYLTLVSWIVHNGIWAVLVSSGVFAIPFLAIILQEWLKARAEGADEGNKGVLSAARIENRVYVAIVVVMFAGIPANNTAVFNVLQDHGMLQPTSDGKAVWRATVTSATGWSHSFTVLRLAPALIWDTGERPAPFAGTVAIDTAPAGTDVDASAPQPAATAKPSAQTPEHAPWEDGGASALAPVPPPVAQAAPDVLEDMLALVGMSDAPGVQQDANAVPEQTPAALLEAPVPAPAAALPSPPAPSPAPSSTVEQPSGEHFMAWLKLAITSRKLVINDAKALVHTVSDTAYLVSPGVFQRYAQEHPQVGVLARQEGQGLQDWQWVQKRFEKLQLHRKQKDGLNIWTCEVTGPRKSRRLHGYLLQSHLPSFSDNPVNNPYLRLAAE
ncbi:hypothetical protein DIE19_18375 [Burkholderia sp. Bp9126]|nr:hypothetical protein DIE19_18375 [Burkholderia sp. Bp9126]